MTDTAWFCLVCDDTGAGERADREAEKHTKTTGHATTTSHHPPIALAQCIDEVRVQLEAVRRKRDA
jgi:hypothetical protein